MRRFGVPLIVLIVCSAFALLGFRHQTGQITRPGLKDMLTQLGYDVNSLDSTEGKEKYSITIEQGGLNIPIAAEISSNDKYIWLTSYLGAPPADTSATNIALLKKNADIQPSMFYITTSGKLMLGLPMENHEVTAAILREKTQDIANNVVDTKDLWQASP